MIESVSEMWYYNTEGYVKDDKGGKLDHGICNCSRLLGSDSLYLWNAVT